MAPEDIQIPLSISTDNDPHIELLSVDAKTNKIKTSQKNDNIKPGDNLPAYCQGIFS